MNYGGQNQNSLAAERFLTNCLDTQRIFLLFPTILIYKQILGVARDQFNTYALIYSTYLVYGTDLSIYLETDANPRAVKLSNIVKGKTNKPVCLYCTACNMPFPYFG
jgi:hypothetical protein